MSDSIFEKSIDDELEQLERLMTVEESEEDVEPEEEVTPPSPPPVIKRRGRKPLSDERKAQLRAQLSKGRASSLAKRKNNAELRKLSRAKEIVSREHDIISSTKSNKDLQEEIKLLKQQMNKDKKNIAGASTISLNQTEKMTTIVENPPTPQAPEKIIDDGPPAWLRKQMDYKGYW